MAGRIDARHLGRLPADEHAAGLPAGCGHAAHHGSHHLRIEAGGSNVIEEEERLGALHQDVISTVVDDVLADGLEGSRLRGQHGLGADAIGGGHQRRRLHARQRSRIVNPAEAADAGQHTGVVRAAHSRAHQRHGFVAGVDGHTGRVVGGGCSPRLFTQCPVL